MKTKTKLFSIMLLMALVATVRVSAQTLIVNFSNGATTEVILSNDNQLRVSDGKYVITVDGTQTEFAETDVESVTYTWTKGDVNRDGSVGIGDIVSITNIMAGNDDEEDSGLGHAPEGAKAVDLGLPSGTKWANMNVGATSPQESGLYFAWGETEGYTSNTGDGRLFDWASYKWMNEGQSSWQQVNKYQVADGWTEACWYAFNWDFVDYEFVGDGKSVLDLEDDAARANWGGDWRMPTYEDFQELLANTTNELITVGTVTGRRFTSKTNGYSIFLPAAGYRSGSSLYYQSTYGYYWLSTVDPSYSNYARDLYFYPGYVSTFHGSRCDGRSIRPVLKN